MISDLLDGVYLVRAVCDNGQGCKYFLKDEEKNILVEKSDHKVGDTILIELPSQNIKSHVAFEKGCQIYLTGGKHPGEVGILEEISGNKIKYKQDKTVYETSKDYAFVIGKDKPIIMLPNKK